MSAINEIKENMLLSKMLEAIEKYPILIIFFLIFMMFYIFYVIYVFLSYAGILTFGLMGATLSYIMVLISNIRSCDVLLRSSVAKVFIILLSILPVTNVIVGIILLIRLLTFTHKTKSNKIPCR